MTNPDTSTLNGALEQLGITMAENLVTMGVSDADPSDGLTTLAGKILDIGPSPTVDSLTLVKSAGKQILSYADSGATPETEYCTLTATALDSNNQGVSGQSVVFKVGTTTVATETTDSNGEASYTYTSQGSGDVVLSAECSSLIQTYSVQDCLYYDDASTDKHSNWDTTDSTDTISYDSTNKHYILTKTTSGDSFIKLTDSIIPSNAKIEFDIRIGGNGSKNAQPRIGLFDTSTSNFVEGRVNITNTYHSISWLGRKNNTWTDLPLTNVSSLAINNWYHCELTFNGSSFSISIYNGSTLLETVTASLSDYLGQTNKLLIDSAYENGSVWNLKNIKVKPL